MDYRSLVRSPIGLFGRDFWDAYDYPSRIMDQCFALPLIEEDLLSPRLFRGFNIRPRTQTNIATSGKSEVANDDKEFKVSLNVCQFKPEELQVKVVDNFVEIHGKHEEKGDEHGFVSREFTRRYLLPNRCESEAVSSSLGPNGVLTILAPKKPLEEPLKNERHVHITQGTGGNAK